MPRCYFCEKHTSLEEKDPETGDVHCHNCGKKIIDRGRLVLFSDSEERPRFEDLEEDVEGDDQDEDEVEYTKSSPLPFFVAFLLGCVVTGLCGGFYLHTQSKQVDFSENTDISAEISPEITEEVPEEDKSVLIFFPDGGYLGCEADEIESENLKALNQQETHFALFEAGLSLELDGEIPLQNMFFFFDEEGKLSSLECEIKEIHVEEVAEEISARFPLLEETEDFLIWSADDGVIGLHLGYSFLHITQEEGRLRSILS